MTEARKLSYSVREAAGMLGVGLNTMYDLIHADGFPSVWLSPRRCVIPCDNLHEWLSEQTCKNVGAPLEAKR